MKTLENQDGHQATRTLSKGEAAGKVGVSKPTLTRWVNRGIFPKPLIKVGRTVRWASAEVDQFLVGGAA